MILKYNQFEIIVDDKYKEKLENKVVRVYPSNNGHSYPMVREGENRKKVHLGAILFGLTKNDWILFKNGNNLDYRESNIEIRKRGDMNRRILKKTNSSFINIKLNKKHNMWEVEVMKDLKRYYGGRYYDEKEAALVADYMNLKVYGDRISPNFPDLSDKDIIQKYEEIIRIYGNTTSERNGRVHQGIRQKLNKEKTSKYIGVHKCNKKNRTKVWVADISKDNKRYRLGYFEKEEEAAEAYDLKAIFLFGQSARINMKESLEKYKSIISSNNP